MNNWRTPGVVLLCGGIILTLAMGTRQGFGLFLQPMTFDHGWSRGPSRSRWRCRT